MRLGVEVVEASEVTCGGAGGIRDYLRRWWRQVRLPVEVVEASEVTYGGGGGI